jgi:tripartite-type tricarboxylate transporter receptor subunit TctC
VGVAGHEVQAAFQGIATVHSLVKANRLKLIAVCTPKRLAQFPDVPTVSESGLSGYEFNSWFALMAPAGTPLAIAQRLHQEVVKALGDAAVREQLLAQGLTPRGASPDELGAALRQQLARYEALFRQAGIRAD